MESRQVNFYDNEIETSLLMVLSNPRDKKLMISNAKHGCFVKSIKTKNRKHSVSEPPIADMVIWENQTKYTCLRVIFVWVITLGICLGSYLLIAFATFKKEESLASNKFDVNCGMFYK